VSDLLEIAAQAARAAGAIQRHYFQSDQDIDLTHKHGNLADPETLVDREAQAAAVRTILSACPRLL
jgi:fructose-1,6-bisphosphatase/inositol monophosphatase family enzyme